MKLVMTSILIVLACGVLSRSQMIKHPAVILHELAHAWHDQYFGFGNKRIVDAYKKAKAAGIYEKVLLYTGKKVRHYALTAMIGIGIAEGSGLFAAMIKALVLHAPTRLITASARSSQL